MGKVSEERGDYEKARELYNTAIERSSANNDQYLNARGMLHRNMGDFEKARADFEKAVKLEPRVSSYHNNLGCLYAELGMIDKARKEWQETLKLSPNNELALKNLAIGRDE